MASYRERKLQDGTNRVTALIEIRIPKSSEKFRDSDTFNKRKDAKKWAETRGKEIRARIKDGQRPTERCEQGRMLADAVGTYIEKDRKGMGKTKEQMLKTIPDEWKIAKLSCDQFTDNDIYRFAEEIADRERVYRASRLGVFETIRSHSS